MEDKLKQLSADMRRKDRDFSLAIGSRDDAVKEAQKLMGHIEALEDRERSRVSILYIQRLPQRSSTRLLLAL
jgi:hypothetical protein